MTTFIAQSNAYAVGQRAALVKLGVAPHAIYHQLPTKRLSRWLDTFLGHTRDKARDARRLAWEDAALKGEGEIQTLLRGIGGHAPPGAARVDLNMLNNRIRDMADAGRRGRESARLTYGPLFRHEQHVSNLERGTRNARKNVAATGSLGIGAGAYHLATKDTPHDKTTASKNDAPSLPPPPTQ